MNPTATSTNNQAGVAAEPVSAPTPLPVMGAAVQVASIRSLSGKQPQAIWVPQTVPSVSEERDTLASRDVLGPETAPTASSSPRIASKRSLLLPSGDEAVLLTRGDSLFRTGDLASARLFYERAANAGSGQAALRLGESYDPHFLEKTHLRGTRGDIETAILWYKRARDLGVSEATILLNSIASK
jgi:TPR repeat protein